MREALNNNPLVQLGVVGVLLVAVAVFLISSGGGGGEEEAGAGATEATVQVAGTSASGTATGATPGEAVEGAIAAAGEAAGGESLSAALAGGALPSTTAARPLPPAVLRAWKANRTLVLLLVHDGGVDDKLVGATVRGLAGFRDAKVFIVPAAKIARYAAITEGVGVDRVPALVVVTPRYLDSSTPTASVSYGFQSPQSVAQAVIDAGYKGKTLDYHP